MSTEWPKVMWRFRDQDVWYLSRGATKPTSNDKIEVVEVVPSGLAALAETAVFACLELLPLHGSAWSGYEVNESIQSTVVALPEEWATAAHAIAELDKALSGLGGVSVTEEEK